MFDFFDMAYNYESRKVDRYETDDMLISTAKVTDSDEPYETAIRHPNYNNDELVIVEMYSSLEDAQKGHDKWVKIMTADKLPEKLVDNSTCGLAKMLDSLDDKDWRNRSKDNNE